MDVPANDRQRVVRDLFQEGWNRQRFAAIAPYLSGPVLFNFRGGCVTTGLEDLKRLVAMWREAFPDLHFEIKGITGSGEVVAINLVFTGTHCGPWQGLAPTGRRIEVEEMMFCRFEDKRLVELWEVFDEYQMRRQLSGEE